MRTLHRTITVLLGIAASVALHGADSKSSRVEVTFSDPEKFTDAADGPRGTDYGREGNLEELKSYLVERASRALPEGQQLSVTITDVDLAGEVEPWRTGSAHDTRIVKDIYTPRITLDYKLTDASGAVVKEGEARLTDLNFNMKLHANRSDPRVHEKALIDDWVRAEFRKAKK
jgi:hypothetical protein